MTAKIVSIRTRTGDDLTPAPALRPVQTISQRQAIKRICGRADPPIWPKVEQRLVEAAEESDRDNGRGDTDWLWRLLALFAFAVSAVSVLYLVMRYSDIIGSYNKESIMMTEHTRKLRQDTANRRAEEVIVAGGWRLRLLLQPDAAKALRDEMQRTGGTATAIISKLLLQKKS